MLVSFVFETYCIANIGCWQIAPLISLSKLYGIFQLTQLTRLVIFFFFTKNGLMWLAHSFDDVGNKVRECHTVGGFTFVANDVSAVNRW
jgi:hypothetical protein